MRVKRFVGKTIQDAMLQVKLEMGKDALILHTRKFKEGGFFGFFAKEYVELTAAVDDSPTAKLSAEPAVVEAAVKETVEVKTMSTAKLEEAVAKNEEAQDDYTELRKRIEAEREKALLSEKEKAEQRKRGALAAAPAQEDGLQAVEEEFNGNGESTELAEMKELVEGVLRKIESSEQKRNHIGLEREFMELMRMNEVEDKLIRKLLMEHKEFLRASDGTKTEEAKKRISESIISLLPEVKTINAALKKNRQMVVAFIGPTGVGKTTTIAKLAAEFAINESKRVALVTADTYRIAAVEQLKTVGDIIGVPVEVVFTPQSMRASIKDLHDRDLVFVDTAGRSHKKPLHMNELKGMLDAAQPDEIYLVLSATTKYSDMLSIVENYKHIDYQNIIFTKLDETSVYGSLINLYYNTKKNLCYLTTGQSVPDDIEVASREKIARLVWGDTDNGY